MTFYCYGTVRSISLAVCKHSSDRTSTFETGCSHGYARLIDRIHQEAKSESGTAGQQEVLLDFKLRPVHPRPCAYHRDGSTACTVPWFEQ